VRRRGGKFQLLLSTRNDAVPIVRDFMLASATQAYAPV